MTTESAHTSRPAGTPPSRAPGQPPGRGAAIAFRALARADLDMLHGWLNEPEVARWYSSGAAPSRAAVRRKYGPRIAGRSPTRVYVCRVDGRDAGLAQTYRLAEYPALAAALDAAAGWAGLDYLLGEPDLRGRRLAHRIIDAFVDTVVAALPGVDVCASLPAHDNVRSARALARAGFREIARVEVEPGQLDRLMIRELR